MTITCFIRDQIDPFKRALFQQYAQAWADTIPRCGGHLLGYFLPHEGTNDEAWGLVAFASLAACEADRQRPKADRQRLKADAQAQSNFAFAQAQRFILRETRSFTEVVESTFQRPAPAAQPA